jgi:hypothetical protein
VAHRGRLHGRPPRAGHAREGSLGGRQAEQEARIANLFPSVPTKITFGSSKDSVTLGISGAEVKTSGVTVKAGPDGAEAEVKKGDVSVGASGKWDGTAFGLKTDVDGVKFNGMVERAGDKWKWSASLVIPLAGEELEELPDISKVVDETRAAVEETVGHIRGGGSPTDGYVTSRMGKVKPAIGAAGQIASGRPSRRRPSARPPRATAEASRSASRSSCSSERAARRAGEGDRGSGGRTPRRNACLRGVPRRSRW